MEADGRVSDGRMSDGRVSDGRVSDGRVLFYKMRCQPLFFRTNAYCIFSGKEEDTVRMRRPFDRCHLPPGVSSLIFANPRPAAAKNQLRQLRQWTCVESVVF